MKKSRCPMCYQPAVNSCRSCRTTIVRNKRGEADYGYRDGRVVYQRRANSSMDDGTERNAPYPHDPNKVKSSLPAVRDLLPGDDAPIDINPRVRRPGEAA